MPCGSKRSDDLKEQFSCQHAARWCDDGMVSPHNLRFNRCARCLWLLGSKASAFLSRRRLPTASGPERQLVLDRLHLWRRIHRRMYIQKQYSSKYATSKQKRSPKYST